VHGTSFNLLTRKTDSLSLLIDSLGEFVSTSEQLYKLGFKNENPKTIRLEVSVFNILPQKNQHVHFGCITLVKVASSLILLLPGIQPKYRGRTIGHASL
jgi:hypothetical protein